MKSVIYSIADEDFRELIKKCTTYTEILRYFGLTNIGANHRTLKHRMSLLNIEFKSAKYNPITRFKNTKALYDILQKNVYYNAQKLKKRLIEEGIWKEDKCFKCGQLPEWNGEKLTLMVDHINGDSRDNRLENLRILCPNCHTQTDTYCGRSKKDKRPKKYCVVCEKLITGNKYNYCRKCFFQSSIWKELMDNSEGGRNFLNHKRKVENRPSKEELLEMIQTESWVSLGKKYGISDNAVRKWARNYGIDPKTKKLIE